MKVSTIFSRIVFSRLRVLFHLALALPLLLTGCSDSSHEDEDQEKEYSAQVVRTEYGIPHITADDWGGLGYGYGYAYAQDNFCVAMKEIVRANGESARYLGEDGSIEQDFIHKLYNTDDYIRDSFLANQDFADLIAGFSAGMNRYLGETGVDALAEGDEGCRGAEWVRELNDTDLGKLLRKLMLRASTSRLELAESISAQDGPDEPAVIAARNKAQKLPFEGQDWQLAGAGVEKLLPKPEELGSNAYAIGGNQTRNGLGLLLGNPHFPWQGPTRFYMVHLTIPGVYNVMGASLHGFPLVNIGFNHDVAWSHTVSTASRFTLYELQVDPNNPMKYLYDGELRDIETQTVSAERLLPSGEVETVEHTFYLSHFGPIIDLSEPAGVGLLADWPTALGTIYAFKDANLYNSRPFETWRGMGVATNVEELLAATAYMGIPWANTIAVDREGNALYADIGAIPHVTQEQIDICVNGIIPPLLTDFGLFTLDGSDPACEWGNDGDAPESGIFGFSSLPKIVTRDYAANANDSYWLSNPGQLLEGFSPIIGEEQVAQTLRTRLTFTQAEQRIAGTDGLGAPGFDVPTLQQLTLGNRNIAAEMLLDDVLAICNSVTDWSSEALTNDYLAQNPAAMPQACSVLAAWDRLSAIDSVGAHVFQEFWFALVEPTDEEVDPLVAEEELLWAVPFDAAAPVITPNTLNTGDADVVMAVKTALAMSVDSWLAEGIPLNRPWGEMQFSPRNGENIPIHGGSGNFSFSVITADRIDGEGYSDIVHGNSIIQTVGWDGSDCPDAFAILTYSQSTDPASPHYADMTRLYSAKGWIDVPFCDQDISAQQIGDALDLIND